MGINRQDLALLIRLIEQGHVKAQSRILEIGAQQLSNSFLAADNLIRKAETLLGRADSYSIPRMLDPIISVEGAELLAPSAPMARDFWYSLGFEYASVDVDGSPGSIPLDLNYDSIPDELKGRFSLVTNFGTTEHICNQLNAFKIIHELTAPGGIMIHHLPAGGAVNHGLVNYNPKFFWYLARSNDYEWLYMNYHGGERPYNIPKNIVEAVEAHEATASKALSKCITADYGLLIAVKKSLDIAFVPPLDVNTGTRTSHEKLNRRYWTVFMPEKLEAARRGENVLGALSSISPDSGARGRFEKTSSEFYRMNGDVSDEIRTAVDRMIGRSEQAIRNAVDSKVGSSEEAVRVAVDQAAGMASEEVRVALASAIGDLKQEMRKEIKFASQRIPGRRFLAALSVGIVIVISAVVLIGPQLRLVFGVG